MWLGSQLGFPTRLNSDEPAGLDFTATYQRASYDLKREIVGALADALGGVHASRDGMHWARGATPPLQDRRTSVGA